MNLYAVKIKGSAGILGTLVSASSKEAAKKKAEVFASENHGKVIVLLPVYRTVKK